MAEQRSPPAAILPSAAILWVGGSDDELAIARQAAGQQAVVIDVPTVAAAISSPPAAVADRSPTAIVLASPTPIAWTTGECTALARRWPLAPLVSVAGTLVDGRRRSGPPLPGVEEVPWHELAGRLAWWLHDRRRGTPGGLGQPATARREERILEASNRVAEYGRTAPAAAVSAAANRAIDLEGLADLLAAVGRPVCARTRGRPPLEDPAAIVVWDPGATTAADLTWLAMLTAHRPARAVVLLDSFPRAAGVRAALDAGAAAVLGRPLSAESLTGILLSLDGGPGPAASPAGL
ncbi:MAG: hypothetical protein ACKON8_05280 [Planctomycetota bacterium]|nr:hypothetical protein [Planctomycetota bacterium]